MTIRLQQLCTAILLLLPGSAAAQVLHTNHDHIPNFAGSPTISSVTSGSWTSAATWSPSRIPAAGDVVRIRHTVLYDSTTGDADVIGVDAGGVLRFAADRDTALRVGTLIVLPNGTLEIGTVTTPIPAHLTAEVAIKNLPINLATDPDQYGTGLIVVDGTVRIHGAAKQPTWVRLAVEPRAGDATLVFEQPVTGWRINDQLVVPDSHEDPTRVNDSQVERRTVQAVSADGRTISLSTPMTHTHPGARDLDGRLVFLPHVMNLTRNVRIRSEAPSGTRGHTMYTHRANVDIRYAEYRDLGRTTIAALHNATNHIGRYALHLHHLLGPGPSETPGNGFQFTVVGNAVYDNGSARSVIKWPIAVHNSHYGLVQGNTVYNAGGSGIVTEDGSESYNVIERNMVVRVFGEGDRMGVKSNGAEEAGSQGVGFWFRGPNNYIRHNVAANSIETSVEAGYGFEVFQRYAGTIRVPNFKGADTADSGHYTTRSIYALPLLEFSDNETYGNPQGLTYWWLGAEYVDPVSTAPSVFRNTKIWHISRYPIYTYEGNLVVFDGLQVYGDIQTANECCNFIWYGDYRNINATIRRSTIVGIDAVVLPYHSSGTTLVEDSVIGTLGGVVNRTSGAPGSCPSCNLPDRVQVIRNVRFVAWPGRPLRAISMDYDTHNGTADVDSRDEVFVYDFQGQPGNHFRAYYPEQASQSIAGGMAPCHDTTTRPEVFGITCAMSGTPPPLPETPPHPPGNARIVTSN